ncbi:putative C-S lyase, partial [Faecalibacterium prausnitzii]|nr:putative C-S lyase [Faecalibacterium prausnitzii]
LTARAQEGIWGYTSRPDSYFEAIRGWQKRRNGWDIDPSLMSFSLGVVQSISAMVKLFTPEGGSVLIQTPVYSEFYDMTEAWNRKVLENPFVEKDGRWEMDWADFEAKLAEADLFLLCSPHNPLGIVWTPEELRRMVELCIKHRVVLFSDEIHSDLIFHGKRHTPTASVSDEAARYVVTGISGTKTFNLAGLCYASIIIPNDEVRAKFQKQMGLQAFMHIERFGPVAHEAAYRHGAEWLEELIQVIKGNYEYVRDFFAQHFPGVVVTELEGTYLVWCDFRCFGMSDADMKVFLTDECMLYLDNGTDFGAAGSGYQRINVACPRKTLADALDRFYQAAKKRGMAR